LFFESGQEPDVTILKEAPEITELYSPDAFVRERLEMDNVRPASRFSLTVIGMSCTFRGLTAGGGASPDQGKRAGGAVASTRVLKAHGAMGRVGLQHHRRSTSSMRATILLQELLGLQQTQVQ